MSYPRIMRVVFERFSMDLEMIARTAQTPPRPGLIASWVRLPSLCRSFWTAGISDSRASFLQSYCCTLTNLVIIKVIDLVIILSLLKRFNGQKYHSKKEATTSKEISCPHQSHTDENRVQSRHFLNKSSCLTSWVYFKCSWPRITSSSNSSKCLLTNLLKISIIFVKCATLFQMADMRQCDIAKKLNKSPRWVSKYCKRDLSNPSNFYDAPRSGAPVTALTPENMKALESCEGKLGQSLTVLRDRLGISEGSVSGGFKKLGLFAYRRSVQSRLKKKHKRIRFQTSKRMRHHDVKYWENYLISDEKIWTVDGYFNPQNDRVRARCKEDVESVERDKFPGKRMV